jgi:hypothetical protein
MDVWSAVAIFLLGAGAGALTTAANYSRQIRELRHLLQLNAGQNLRNGQTANTEGDEKRKSA